MALLVGCNEGYGPGVAPPPKPGEVVAGAPSPAPGKKKAGKKLMQRKGGTLAAPPEVK